MNHRFKVKKAFLRGLAALAPMFLAGACVFSDGGHGDPAPPAAADTTVREEVPLDSLLFSGPSPQRTVDLYQPRLSTDLAPNAEGPLLQAFPRRVREAGSGEIVEYRWSQRSFGSWNAARERDFNLFLLRAYFLEPAGLFEDTAGLGNTGALYARAQQYDRFTRYIDSTAAEEYRRRLLTTEEPRAVGIQVQANDAGDSLSLILVAPGSPAWRAGLRRGMRVLAVNDSAVTGDSALARFVRFADLDTNAMKLAARGPQGVTTVMLVREKVDFPTVIADSLSGVGYIAISSFTASTLEGGSTLTEFKDALEATKRFPATVIDLRGNGGGDFGIALSMCEQVLDGGVIFRVKQRRFQDGASVRYEVTYKASPGHSGEGRRFVLLADSNSASASELFIAALRDGLDAPFRGTRTYGKGVGQAAFTTPGNGYALMTYGTVLTASGLDYNGTGLQPTHPSTAKPEAMLAEAVAQAQGLSKRAADARPAGEGRAALADWNRRQIARPGVYDLVIPVEP